MTIDHKGKTLEFKISMNLETFGKLMGVYDEAIVLATGKHGMYQQFADWLIFMDYVQEKKS